MWLGLNIGRRLPHNLSVTPCPVLAGAGPSGSDSHGSYAETLHTSDQALTGTTLKGGDTVNIVSGKDITLSGSAISLDKGNANLLAAGDVNVGAATETHELNSHETHNRGNADGDSSTWTNTHVSAGNELAIQSGGDTNLKGAVASGKQVVADIGGNLNIESLQDKDHYDSKQQSAGISASVCAPPLCTGKSSVAGSIGQTKMNSDYASVIEQSGIKAGDGGFQVDVKGNTDLKGGVVASSDKAVQDNLNKLTTSTLTHRDIEIRQ